MGAPIILFSIICLVTGILWLLRKRELEKLATTPSIAVRPGLVQMEGTAAGTDQSPSPIFQIPCYCSLVLIYRKSTRVSSIRQQQLKPFKVQDRHGSILVDPTGAEFDLKEDAKITLRDGKVFHFEGKGKEKETVGRASAFGQDVTASECNLCRNDPVFVIGTAEKIAGEKGPKIVIRKRKGALLYVAESSKEHAIAALKRRASIALIAGGLLAALGIWLLVR